MVVVNTFVVLGAVLHDLVDECDPALGQPVLELESVMDLEGAQRLGLRGSPRFHPRRSSDIGRSVELIA